MVEPTERLVQSLAFAGDFLGFLEEEGSVSSPPSGSWRAIEIVGAKT